MGIQLLIILTLFHEFSYFMSIDKYNLFTIS